MWLIPGLILLLCTSAFAQADNSPEIAAARADIAKLKVLVEAGAAPRLQLEKAEAALSDAEDAAYLRKTVYGSDLNEAQTDDMLAAAQRRVDRRRNTVSDTRRLIEEGVASQLALTPVLLDL